MRYTLREQLLAIASSGVKQIDLAEQLGVSVRTLRRWKNEGVHPSKPRRDAGTVSAVAQRARTARARMRDDQKHYHDYDKTTKKRLDKPIETLAPIQQKIVIPQMREKLRDRFLGYSAVYVKDPVTGERKKRSRERWSYRLSDTVFHDSRVLTIDESLEYAYGLLRKNQFIRFVIKAFNSTNGEEFEDGKAHFIMTEMLSPENLKVQGKLMTLEQFSKWAKLHSKKGVARVAYSRVERIISGDAFFNHYQ